MAGMLEHTSKYLYDFENFIFASIRCTIPNFQTCEQFCCLLYVKRCDLCNRTKNFPMAPTGKLMPNCMPDHWWQVISVDLIMELPQSHGYDTLLIMVDRLSKWTHVIPTMSDVTSLSR